MASQDDTDIFNPEKHTKLGDIVVIGGDVNLYKVTSTSPLRVENLTGYPNGEIFNLTHFMKNFKKYMELVKETNAHNPWGDALVQQYEKYILDFINLIYTKFPKGAYTFSDFLIFFYNLLINFDKSKKPPINFEQMERYFNELENTDLYISRMKSTLGDAPQFKKHKLPKKSSKKTPKKSSKKTPKKSSKKSPKKSSKKSPKPKRQ